MKGDNICKSTIVHKALEGSIRLSNNVQFWLNWPLLFVTTDTCCYAFCYINYLNGNFLIMVWKYTIIKCADSCRIYQHDMHPMRTSRACMTSIVIKTVLDWWIINLGPSYTVSGNLGEGLSPVPETKWMGPSLFSLHVEPSGLTI